MALALIGATGPLLATSANISDQPDTLGADEVLIAFATQQDELAAVVDGGAVPVSISVAGRRLYVAVNKALAVTITLQVGRSNNTVLIMIFNLCVNFTLYLRR